MKKIVLIFIILLSLNINHINAYDDIYDTKNINSSENINLIKTYIYRLQSQINIFVKKYKIESIKIDDDTKNLNNLVIALNNLQNKKYSNEEYNKIMELILNQLRKNKDNIKNILQIEKDKYEKKYKQKKQLYKKISNQVR